mgnify:CR=1 FL=1|tara:strand:- start:97 stop:600 length:504 start_codon:yes stop_codon:yes gene_type:complete
MKSEKIIISGPPSSGKTTIINELKKRGYTCMPEISPPNLDLKIKKNKLIISEFIFLKREEQYMNVKHQTCFYDRSLIDIIAYMNLWEQEYPLIWNKKINQLRYNQNVFYTPFWKKIYKQTSKRNETQEEAQEIDSFLRKTFLQYNYTITEVPKLNVSERVNFIINNI